jgi:hypothetical protein
VAKKARTPPPPRRVQAPKTRTTPRSAEDRKRIAVLAGGAALALVALAAVVGFFALSGSDGAGDISALENAGCTVQTFPAQQGNHVTELPAGYKHNSDPPTSGAHGSQPAAWDLYDEPVDQLIVIHNLEHGGVVIQYGDEVPESDVTGLVDWYRDDPNGIVIAPRPELGDQIALEAWNGEKHGNGNSQNGTGVLVKCPRFDDAAFDAFLEEYGFKGPELIPRDDLHAGEF